MSTVSSVTNSKTGEVFDIEDTTARNSISSLNTTVSTKVTKIDGKGLSSNDFSDEEKDKLSQLKTVATTGSYNDLTNKPVIPDGVKVSTESGNAITEKEDGLYVSPTGVKISEDTENSIESKTDGLFVKKVTIDSELSDSSSNPIQNKVIKNSMGAAFGFATLDENGKVPTSQMPTTAKQIVGEIDCENVHELPVATEYNSGDELIVVTNGYYVQSTAFTLKSGKILTVMEVAQANKLIAAGYTFTLKDSESTLGIVKNFTTNEVMLSDDTVISLPYDKDLSATSDPSTVQVTTNIGDEIMNINDHWIHLSNTSNVTSVNGKKGAVTISGSDFMSYDSNTKTLTIII